MKILFITPWYPTVNDSMSGLFVEKIVRAAEGKKVDCRVVFSTNVLKLFFEVLGVLRSWGRPDLVHLHVATKQGLVALLLKRVFGIRYVLTEHWSGYLPENGDYERRCGRWLLGRLYVWLTRRVVGEAEVVTAVSGLLRENMLRCGLLNRDFRVVHNVVDDVFEHGYERGCGGMTFLHVSCFDNRAKNVFGIVRAAASLRDRGVDFRLTMVGEGPDYEECRELAEKLRLNDVVMFTGVLQSEGVCEEMKRNSCFVLFSNYETAGVVLQEALAMGMGVISTRVGVVSDFSDLIECVPVGDTEALADAMQRFSPGVRRRVSFEGVVEEYVEIYREVAGE